ncbi:MAG: ABC transporter permease [Lachnospiraceae bacterium]|nr:ABC transporter permease [Lachnospiraceae bacterium]
MTGTATEKLNYTGRLAQFGITFRKFLRMFVYQSDWIVLPIGAVIAALVTFVVGSNMFVTQEGTTMGTFALTCVCVWNGFFNSIQVVCRERDIVKKEHRAGMYLSSYILAHIVYQLILCLLQTLITLLICGIAGVKFPGQGIITPWGIVDMGITILLVTYAADVMALMVSCIVKTTTAAMTVMPFLLIYQLIFSGSFFDLGAADPIKLTTISHWGTDCLCAIGRYNELPMVTLWNTLVQFKDAELFGEKPLLYILQNVEKNGMLNDFLLWSGQNRMNPAYASTPENVLTAWGAILLMVVVFAVVAVITLKLIDKDQR